MKSIWLAALAVVLVGGFPAAARGGNIFGTVWLSGRGLAGAQIEIACPGRHAAETDANGSYRVFVPERGRCTILVRFQGQSAQADIASYDNAIKYDFDVIRQGSGYILKRR